MSLFGSSGIRGVVGERVTADLALAIGSAISRGHDRVVMGMDSRTSGRMVQAALAAGLTAGGADVRVGGVMSTPTLARAAAGHSCGLMVTASHNPREYNGVKMWNPDGSAFDRAQMDDVEASISSGPDGRPPWDSIGRVEDLHGCVESHMEAVLDSVGGAETDVVVDCACGATCSITPRLVGRMGCTVLSINAHEDGRFPGRMPEPTEENLGDLMSLVRSRGARVGIAHDGDGDRVVAVDERGRYVGGDDLLALFASSHHDVVVPINASMAIDDLVPGRVVRTRVGDVYVSDALKREGIAFGGEPSGTYVFSDETYCPDGVLAAAMIIRMASEGSLAEMVDDLPRFPMRKRTIWFEERGREDVMGRLADVSASIEADRVITVDGIRAETSDGWFLIRASGTEPKVRVTVEARDESTASSLLDRAMDVARGCVS